MSSIFSFGSYRLTPGRKEVESRDTKADLLRLASPLEEVRSRKNVGNFKLFVAVLSAYLRRYSTHRELDLALATGRQILPRRYYPHVNFATSAEVRSLSCLFHLLEQRGHQDPFPTSERWLKKGRGRWEVASEVATGVFLRSPKYVHVDCLQWNDDSALQASIVAASPILLSLFILAVHLRQWYSGEEC